MSSSLASLVWDICCSSLQLEGTVHLGSQTNRKPSFCHGKLGTMWGHSVSFDCSLENCMHVAQLTVSSFMYLDIPGQMARIRFLLLLGGTSPFPAHVSWVYYLQHLWAEPTRDHKAVALGS